MTSAPADDLHRTYYDLQLTVRIPAPVLRPEGHRHTLPENNLAGLAVMHAMRDAGISVDRISVARRAGHSVPLPICPHPDCNGDHPC